MTTPAIGFTAAASAPSVVMVCLVQPDHLLDLRLKIGFTDFSLWIGDSQIWQRRWFLDPIWTLDFTLLVLLICLSLFYSLVMLEELELEELWEVCSANHFVPIIYPKNAKSIQLCSDYQDWRKATWSKFSVSSPALFCSSGSFHCLYIYQTFLFHPTT